MAILSKVINRLNLSPIIFPIAVLQKQKNPIRNLNGLNLDQNGQSNFERENKVEVLIISDSKPYYKIQ